MNFLIIYGTTEGQTRKIAEFVAGRVKAHKHGVVLLDATSDEAAEVKLRDYDGVVVAASLHAGLYQAAVESFVRAHHETLNGTRTLFLSVSLSAASKDAEDLVGLKKCLDRFLRATGWKPGEVRHVIGAFRYTQYDFFKRWGMKLIAYEKGVSTDTSKDLELTDWGELAGIADAFVTTVAKAQGAGASA
jgi:menaquinone-dependent protoporphyrinogen oxidase